MRQEESVLVRLGRSALAVAALVVLGVAGQLGTGQPIRAAASNPADSARRGAAFASLPIEAQTSISGTLGRDLQGYEVTAGRSKEAFQALNVKQGLTADFTPASFELRRGAATWDMAVQRYGYGARLMPVRAAIPQAGNNRVEYHRGRLTEWYVNGPLGIEQGFTLSKPPSRATQAGAGDRNVEPLTVAIGISGNMKASIDDGSASLTLTPVSGGEPALRYRGLSARDADDKELNARMEIEGAQLLLRVDDAGARYPVTIDPILQVAKLTASDGAANDFFGWAVAAIGNTVVVGAASDIGEAYVFVKPASGWANITETARLTPSDGETSFGESVAISGGTVVVGAPDAGNFAGAAYVFVEPSSGWTNMTETAKLTTPGGGTKFMGWSVATSGSTVVAGAPNASFRPNVDQGAAYVFVEPAGGWRTTSSSNARLTATDPAAYDSLGYSVSISGNTIVAGADGKDAVYLYQKPAAGWTNATQNAKLTSTLGLNGDALGLSVTISGNTVVAGAPDETFGSTLFQGAVFIWVKPGAGWTNTTQTAELTASDGAAFDTLGWSVALSGNVVVAGQNQDINSKPGTAYVYIEPASGWANMTESTKLTPGDSAIGDLFGHSVAVAGKTVVAGAYQANIGANAAQGAAYVFNAQGLE